MEMMAVHSHPGAWWKQLSDFLHQRTENQLRRLTIRTLGGRVAIHATAPCDRIRVLAETAAKEAVPPQMLTLAIRVDSRPKDSRSLTAALPDAERLPAPKLFDGEAMHRRLQRLVAGN
jgi:hypothetical protein